MDSNKPVLIGDLKDEDFPTPEQSASAMRKSLESLDDFDHTIDQIPFVQEVVEGEKPEDYIIEIIADSTGAK